MDLTLFLTAVGVLIALVTVIVSAVTYRRGHPKKELRYKVESVPILGSSAVGLPQLKVTLDSHAVSNPYVVTLDIWSSGRADIPSASFDGGTPIAFNLGASVVGELADLQTPESVSLKLELRDPNLITLGPVLIRRSASARLQFIVEGQPSLSADHSLIDINVIEEGAKRPNEVAVRTHPRRWALRVAFALVAVGFVAMVVGLSLFQVNPPVAQAIGSPGLFVLMVGGVVAGIAYLVQFIRWLARRGR